MKVGILGGNGYAGLELIKLIDKHPQFKISMLGSRQLDGVAITDVTGYPLRQDYTFISLEKFEDRLERLDLLFLSLPHGTSMKWAKKAIDLDIPVIDLSGDFRLKSRTCYEKWYKTKHLFPDLLETASYGLADVQNTQSNLIANPGCYPTATLLGLLPLTSTGLLNDKLVVVDAKSGMSGAGKKMNPSNLYCEANESIRPYGTGVHRHTPEIEQTLKAHGTVNTTILFSPSIVPMERGILSSIYISNCEEMTLSKLKKLYESYYMNTPFVRLNKSMPETKWVKNTNYCDIHLIYDERSHTVIIHSVIDNLIKGAAGQAVQNANKYFGFDERIGLI